MYRGRVFFVLRSQTDNVHRAYQSLSNRDAEDDKQFEGTQIIIKYMTLDSKRIVIHHPLSRDVAEHWSVYGKDLPHGVCN
jgi:hypothetical protein